MEVKNWSYEDLPEYLDCPEGAEIIETDGNEKGVEYLNDVVYSHTPQGDLRLQILVPVCRNRKPVFPGRLNTKPDGTYLEGVFDHNPQYPCILHVQGSGWFPQLLYRHLPKYAKLAERGFVLAIVEYRDCLRAKYPAPILDTLNAIRFLRSNSKMYCINPNQIFLSGDSSGGHTALMAGLWCKQDPGENAYPGVSAEIKGVISHFAASDFLFEDSNPTMMDHGKATSPEGMEMGGVDLTPEMAEMLTCRTHVTPEAEIPPILLFHGTKDRQVNTKCSVYLYERLKECGKEASLYLIKGGDHGGPEFWTNRTIDLMEKFVRSKL